MEKRGKGKIITDYGARELYRLYAKERNQKKKVPVDEATFRKVKNLCNQKISEKILKGDWYQLPYGLGILGISKYEVFFHNARRRAIDFKATREKGYNVFYEDLYQYKWIWRRTGKLIKFKSYYSFKACRKNTRSVKVALQAGYDFYTR